MEKLYLVKLADTDVNFLSFGQFGKKLETDLEDTSKVSHGSLAGCCVLSRLLRRERGRK